MLFSLPMSFGSLLIVESARGEVVQALGLVSVAVVMGLLVTLLLGRRDERAPRGRRDLRRVCRNGDRIPPPDLVRIGGR